MVPVTGTAFVLFTLAKVILFFTLLLLLIAFTALFERKVAGFIQDRSGPNRVGPWGILQSVADGLKLVLKEETWPARANRAFFLLAPALAIVPATVIFAVIPFAAPLPTRWGLVDIMVANAPIGFLYVLALSSIGVYGIVMAGWSSNNKYSFLGGLRGSAQMISYEIGLAMSLVPILLLAGDVMIPTIIATQQGFSAGPTTLGVWFLVPLTLGGFFFFVSALAETNRLPFDLPEAEAELVGGYHTEYSAMKFGSFYLGEYAHMLTVAGLVTVFFLGGWDIPFWTGDNIRVLADGTVIGEPTVWKTVLTFVAFSVKATLLVTVFVWIRWTLPRFRYDQLMDLGWKVFIPALLTYILVVAAAVWTLDQLEVSFGPIYAAILLGLNLVLALVLFMIIDRGSLVRGAGFRAEQKASRTSASTRYGRRPMEPVR
jgi:NADH-quinone oxidoreductase subunit H